MLPTNNYSARDTAVTQRPTSTALLTIDSEDRFADYIEARKSYASTPYDFSVRQPSSLMNGFFTRLGVSEINFPYVIPNINIKTNKIIFTWIDALSVSHTTTFELDPGFYTPNQLAETLQALVIALDPALADFTMVYGSINLFDDVLNVQDYPGFCYNTNDANITCYWTPMTYMSTDYPYPSNTRQLFDLLGFNDENSTDNVSLFGGTTYCQATKYIDIVCNQLTYNQALKDTSSQKNARDALCRIYVVEPGSIQSGTQPSAPEFCPPGCAPTTLYRNFTQPKQIQWLPNQPITGDLRFSVYDDEGDLLSMTDNLSGFWQDEGSSFNPGGNKTNWSMTLLVTEN